MIQDLLIVIDNSVASELFLKAAITFAERAGAHTEVEMLSPGPLAATELAPFGALYVPEEVLRKEQDARLAEVRAAVAGARCPVEVYGLQDDVAWMAHDLRVKHPMADLIVIGTKDCWEVPWLRRRVIETLLLTSGTPMLVLPPERPLGPIHRAVIGWKPSREANRAVHDFVALAEPGAAVELVMVGADEDARTKPHLVEVERHLVRHGFKVSVQLPPPGDWSTTAEVLEHHAIHHEADLLVVGGYAHSRVREVVLGGVTRDLIHSSRLPVLLSH